ncbi:hypothetical protein ACFQ51_10585 [Streptomyces kaempferi]
MHDPPVRAAVLEVREPVLAAAVRTQPPWCGPLTAVFPCSSTTRSSYGPKKPRERKTPCQPVSTPRRARRSRTSRRAGRPWALRG